jgi:ribulose-5-phosphate 4-epimerase/fuculose-1-phosphate aldolase
MMLLFQKVPVCRYGRPSTQAVCDDIPAAVAAHDTFLLANHGLTTVGGSPMEAVYRLESIESIAKVLTLARMGGGEVKLPEEEQEFLARAYRASRPKE